MTEQNAQTEERLEIHGACTGEFDDKVTPELMRSLGLEVHTDEQGNFHPLSQKEMGLLGHDEVISVGSKGVIRFVRAYLEGDKKLFNFSDDDYSDEDTVERTLNNYNESREAFQKMAKAFEVELSDERNNHDNGNIADYWLDIYVPFEKLEGVETASQMIKFFETCSFESPESIKEAIKAINKEQ